MKIIPNKGIDLEREARVTDGSEWVGGSSSPLCLVYIPEEEREKYLPKGELQRGVEDFMDCATRAPLNILETKLTQLYSTNDIKPENKKWLEDNGYVVDGRVVLSDRFNAILSGTTRSGNSLKEPLDSIRKDGVIPKKMLPANSKMTFADYHKRTDITSEMVALGLESTKRFQINYEKVYETNYLSVLIQDMLVVAGYAWEAMVKGVYPRTDKAPNHSFAIFKRTFFAFDNYEEEKGDWIKQLAPDYNFLDYGYRLYIACENDVQKLKIGIIERILYFLGLLKAQTEPLPLVTPPQPKELPPPPIQKYPKLTQAIIMVESGGNDGAIGDKHLANKAYGPMQIRKPCIDDVNKRHGTSYRAQDCLGNRELSMWVFEKYVDIYANGIRLGRPVTDQDRARVWNGGPNGYKNPGTVGYWNKVKKFIK